MLTAEQVREYLAGRTGYAPILADLLRRLWLAESTCIDLSDRVEHLERIAGIEP
jgi:hypothetical protein